MQLFSNLVLVRPLLACLGGLRRGAPLRLLGHRLRRLRGLATQLLVFDSAAAQGGESGAIDLSFWSPFARYIRVRALRVDAHHSQHISTAYAVSTNSVVHNGIGRSTFSLCFGIAPIGSIRIG